VLALNAITLVFVLLHAVTWFNLAPRAIVVRVRSWRVPPVLILALHYLLWGLLSAIVLWVVLR
jgi:fumarate reductase subunit C